MKKLLCSLLVLAMVTSFLTCVSHADGFTRVEGVYEIDEYDYTQVEDCSLYKFDNGKNEFGIRKDVIGDDGIKYLLSVFSNDNLNCIVSDVTEHITSANNPNYPIDGIEFNYKIKNGENYNLRFDEKYVWYNYNISTDDGIIVFKEGLFEFNDSSIYDELAKRIEQWDSEQDEINEQNEIDRKKNPVSVSDFKILYEARVKYWGKSDLVFGVCTYKREKNIVMALYHLVFETDSKTIFKIAETKPISNTFVTENYRLLEFDTDYTNGVEYYDDALEDYRMFKIQVNVDKNLLAKSLTVMEKIPTTDFVGEDYIDMSQYHQIGTLPSEWFSVDNNVEYPNKLTYFEKLYSEKITTHHGVVVNGVKQGAEREWGICKYSNELSGNVHAFYLYDKSTNKYYISEIDEVFYNKEIDNVITFDTTRFIHNNFEINEKYANNINYFMLRIGINQNNEIQRRSFLISYGSDTKFSSCTILDTQYLSGNLDSLSLEDYFTSDTYKAGLEAENKAKEEYTQKTEESDAIDKSEEISESATENKTTESEQKSENITDSKKEEIKEDTLPEKTDESDEKNKNNSEAVSDETVNNTTITFLDVPSSHWAHNEISLFAQNGIVLGYGNGYFGVNDSITYEHFALLLNRLFAYDEDDKQPVPAVREDVIVSVVKALNIDVSNANTNIIYEKFSDCSQLQQKNLKYIAAAIELGLVVGSYGELHPHDNLTRAETVMLLHRAVAY